LLAGLLSTTVPSFAHHAFESEFDTNRPGHLEGRVTKVTWTNPHVVVDVDVTSGTGAASHLQLELPGLTPFFRAGMNKETLQPNADLVVDGFRSKTVSSTTIGTSTLKIKATGQGWVIESSAWHHSFAGQRIPSLAQILFFRRKSSTLYG